MADGSERKVHPDHYRKVREWDVGDIIHATVRTSFYWFKREHKFCLYNLSKNDSIKVMLLRHKDRPLFIVDASDPYPTTVTYRSEITYDSSGNVIDDFTYADYDDYQKNLILSNRTVWSVTKKFSSFYPTQKIYVGNNDASDLGKEILMPTDFDDFTKKAHRDCTDLPKEALDNRKLLQDMMEMHDFIGLPTEWWHFDLFGWESYPPLDIMF